MKPAHPDGTTTRHSTANGDSLTTKAPSQRQPPAPVPATSSKCVGVASPFVGDSVGLCCQATLLESAPLTTLLPRVSPMQHPRRSSAGRRRRNVNDNNFCDSSPAAPSQQERERMRPSIGGAAAAYENISVPTSAATVGCDGRGSGGGAVDGAPAPSPSAASSSSLSKNESSRLTIA